MGSYNASPSLSRDALDAALTDDAALFAGPFSCVAGCGMFKVQRHEGRIFVCPECRSALVPARIADDPQAVKQYVGVVLGGR